MIKVILSDIFTGELVNPEWLICSVALLYLDWLYLNEQFEDTKSDSLSPKTKDVHCANAQ